MWRDVLIGTYTWRDAEGIYRGRFDEETGAFETLGLAIAADSPAFLVPRGDMLYAVNEQREGGVSAFRCTGTNVEFVDAQPSGGSLPCHLSVGHDWVAVANYGSGTVALFPTAGDDGRLLPMADSRQHRGNGPNTDRQESAHAHEVYALGSTLVVPDLGTDKVHRYRVGNGRLSDDGHATLPSGSGPRHVELHPSLPRLYVLNELGNTVDVLSWPDLEAVQRIDTLPADVATAPAQPQNFRSPLTGGGCTHPTAATTASCRSPSIPAVACTTPSGYQPAASTRAISASIPRTTGSSF